MLNKKTFGGYSTRQLVAMSNYRCIYCENAVQYIPYHTRWQPRDMATIEHLIPQAHGGTNELKNIKIACSQCNNLRQTMDYKWFKSFIDDLRARSTFVDNWHSLRTGELQFVKIMCRTRYRNWYREYEVNFMRRRPINT